ncbi:hypothetical protein ACLB1M_12545 [Escherichia coli]
MSKHDTDTSDQHAAKRRWLNAHEEGYHKAMDTALHDCHWRRDWHRLVFRCRSPTALGRVPAFNLVYLICGLFSFLSCVHWVKLVLHRPSSGSFVSCP